MPINCDTRQNGHMALKFAVPYRLYLFIPEYFHCLVTATTLKRASLETPVFASPNPISFGRTLSCKPTGMEQGQMELSP